MSSTGITAPKQIANQQASALHANDTIRALVVHTVDADGNYVSPGAGSTQLSIREILTSSGASVMDSTLNAIGVTIRGGAASGTEYTDGDVDVSVSGGALMFDNGSNTVRSVNSTRGLPVNVIAGTISVSTQVAVSSVAGVVLTQLSDRDFSTKVAAILGSAPTSTTYGLIVRLSPADANGPFIQGQVSHDGANVQNTKPVAIGGRASAAAPTDVDADNDAVNIWALRNGAIATVVTAAGALIGGDAANGLDVDVTRVTGTVTIAGVVRSTNSVAADLQATVTPVAGSTWATRPLQSSQGDLRATVYQSTASDFVATVRLNTSSGGALEGSTTTQSTGGVLGLNIREVMPSGRQSTTVVITSTHSTALYTLISSAAGLKQCVTAYFVGSTHTNPSTLVFWSSNAIDRWAVNFGSGSSGITGANLATQAPDWLFQTDVANALRVSIEGGSSVTSTVIARISLKWFSEA